jgi:heptosyltransferase II
MKILVIALSGIGDALMFTPSLVKLASDFPQAEIEALVMYKGVFDIYSGNPGLSRVHYFDFLKESPFKAFRYLLRLRKRYDISISVYPSNRKEYNLISFLIGAKKRAAVRYLRRDIRELGFLNNIRTTENDSRHNVRENLLLCEKLSGNGSTLDFPLRIILKEEETVYAGKFLEERSINSGDLVVGFHPGCSTLKNHDKRRWETSKFTCLAKKLIEDFGAKIMVFGGNDEEHLKSVIEAGTGSAAVIPVRTGNLLQTAALMKRCDLFVTNDSSLMHLAAALKLKIIALLGPTNRNYIAPWQSDFRIASLELDCSPCFIYSPKPLSCSRRDVQFKCIKELSVNMVYNIAAEWLNPPVSRKGT